MKEFDALLEVADILMGPGGCPWDHKQTLTSLQPYLIEEAHESVEAIDSMIKEDIVEELGDLLYTIVFLAKVGEKENFFTMAEVIEAIKDKLIRRHPHVFSKVKADTLEEIEKNWIRIKKEEGKKGGVPPSMPLIMRAQKIIKKYNKKNIPLPKPTNNPFAEKFFTLLQEAAKEKLDCEGELRRAVRELEKSAGDDL